MLQCPVAHFIDADSRLLINALKNQVLQLKATGNLLSQEIRVAKSANLNSVLQITIPIHRRYTLQGRSEHRFAKPLFLVTILQSVKWKTDAGTLGNLHVAWTHIDALRGKLSHLLRQPFKIDHRTRTENIDDRGIKNSGGHQTQDKAAMLVHNRVTGIVSTLITDHEVSMVGKVIDHTPFTLITPISTNDNSYGHLAPFLKPILILTPGGSAAR